MPRFALALIALASPLLALAQAPKGPKLPDGAKAELNLAYGDHERNKLDLYLPKADKPLPLVIWVHGGGWEAGDKGGGGPALPLLAEGYAVASVNYRYSKQAVFPAQSEDVRAAVRYLRANAKKYGLNPDAFGAWGASAGGHLVALLAVGADVKELDGTNTTNAKVSSAVQAVVDWFGPADMTTLSQPGSPANPVTRLLGGDAKEKSAVAKLASPVAHAGVGKAGAPLLIVHGDKDTLVPLKQSEKLAEAYKTAGGDVELVVLPGAGHGGPQFSTPEMRKKTLAFFDKHLKK